MAHFVELDENHKVLRVIVVADEYEADGENWCNHLLGGTWKQTSYNTYRNVHRLGGTPFRKNYAGSGFTYDVTRDAFIPPHEFASWTLNESTCHWEPPVARPNDGNIWEWDEDTLQWIRINQG